MKRYLSYIRVIRVLYDLKGDMMSNELIEIFKAEQYENSLKTNGIQYWLASEFMILLGYTDMKAFRRVINKAVKSMMGSDIDHFLNIIAITIEGKTDFKLTRFACYIVAMNGDAKKKPVAEAQSYFAMMARAYEIATECSDDVERLSAREELKENNKHLASAAKHAGVEDYAKFTNAGYLGMYNKMNWKLAQDRGIKPGKVLDHMGRTELAANQFRLIMTEEKIKNEKIKGQLNLEHAHNEVSRDVRNTVKKNTGKFPEDLPVYPDLKEARKQLKKDNKKLIKMDEAKE